MAAEALDAYLHFLDSSTTTSDKEAQPTPHIDNILLNYQQRNLNGGKRNEVAAPTESYEGRLFQLEKQLTDLLQRSKTGSPRKITKRVTSDSENSESHENSPPPSTLTRTSATRRQRPQGAATVCGSRSARDRHVPLKRSSSSIRERGRKLKGLGSGRDVGQERSVSSADDDRRKKSRLLMETQKQQHRVDEKDATSLKMLQSSSRRDELRRIGASNRNIGKALSDNLDREKERRWKAEQAAGRLVEHVRKLQSQLSECERHREQCVVREAKLDQELREKAENLTALLKEVEELQTTTRDKETEIRKLKSIESKHLEMLQKLEESCRVIESERLREKMELRSLLHESERNAAAYQREVETVKRNMKELKRQVQQLQELLANREREHMREMEKCKPPAGHEVSDIVRKEVERECSRMEVLLEQQKKLLCDKDKAYHDLEEEFRLALRIEASRHEELQTSHQAVVNEVQSSRETALAAVKKEQRATALVAELTAMIKEQKARISELNRNKEELVANLKQHSGELAEAVSCRNKLEVKAQVLQEENSRLTAQTSAQESIIGGLREERQLWGKELAQQGAALAQDRGRMEAQIDSLTKDCKSLREELVRERDSVRIKEKQVEDQLETIHQLKQEMSGKDHELQSRKLEWQREQQSLQLLLEQEEASNQELQEQITALAERKDELKEVVASSQLQTEQWKEKYSKLKGQWEEKTELLSRLEENMTDIQASFKEKETLLMKDRDQAVEGARSCEQRLKSCDDAFRHQLEAKQRAHDCHVTKIVAEKDRQIAQANERVSEVEEEMRELLKEVATERQNMELKLQKLSQAFQELHVHDA